jgi:hypothetical protein
VLLLRLVVQQLLVAELLFCLLYPLLVFLFLLQRRPVAKLAILLLVGVLLQRLVLLVFSLPRRRLVVELLFFPLCRLYPLLVFLFLLRQLQQRLVLLLPVFLFQLTPLARLQGCSNPLLVVLQKPYNHFP